MKDAILFCQQFEKGGEYIHAFSKGIIAKRKSQPHPALEFGLPFSFFMILPHLYIARDVLQL